MSDNGGVVNWDADQSVAGWSDPAAGGHEGSGDDCGPGHHGLAGEKSGAVCGGCFLGEAEHPWAAGVGGHVPDGCHGVAVLAEHVGEEADGVHGVVVVGEFAGHSDWFVDDDPVIAAGEVGCVG